MSVFRRNKDHKISVKKKQFLKMRSINKHKISSNQFKSESKKTLRDAQHRKE